MYFFYQSPASNTDAEKRHLSPSSFFLVGAILLHLISGFTEIFSFYNIAYSEISKYLPSWLSKIFSGAFSLVITFVIEWGIYVFFEM